MFMRKPIYGFLLNIVYVFFGLVLPSLSYSLEGVSNPLEEVYEPQTRVAYCYYAFNLRAQNAAQMSSPGDMSALLKNVQDWQAGIEKYFPDRRELSASLVDAKNIFDNQLESFPRQPGAAATTIQSQLLKRSEQACENELQQLANYVPPLHLDETPIAALAAGSAPVIASLEPQVPAQDAQEPITFPPSPFTKGIFNPGWKGDLLWASGETARMVVSSFDEIQAYAQDPAIHINSRSFGNDVRAYCIGHMVEFERSLDGRTLYLAPASDSGCAEVDTVLSVHAAAADRVQIKVIYNKSVVARGELWPHNRAKLLVMNVVGDKELALPKVAQQPEKPSMKFDTTKTKPTVPDDHGKKEECVACLAVDTEVATQVPSPYTAGFFNVTWQGRFHWDWHHVDYATVRTEGRLTKKTDAEGPDNKLTLQLDFDAEYSEVCVGDLREIGRSVQGYIVHFEVVPSAGQGCNPRVTHAYLYPLGFKDQVEPPLRMVLYRGSQLISAGFIRPPENSPIVFRVDPAVALQARAAIEGLEKIAAIDLKQTKSAVFQASAEYDDIKPLYDACMAYQPDIYVVIEREPYCQCVSEKVGIGSQITGIPVGVYVDDFGQLVTRLHGPESEENKLYYRLGESCRHCSDERYALEPYCSGPDTLLYAATDYEKFIRLLETNAPKIEATDYYKKVFYRTYLQGYSAYCGDQIQDPVPFVYTVTETTVGGWDHGNVNVIQRDETLVERRYAEKYGRFYDEINTPSSGGVDLRQTMSTAATQATYQGIRRQISDAQSMLETERANRTAISQHLQQGCDAQPVIDSYARLFYLVD